MSQLGRPNSSGVRTRSPNSKTPENQKNEAVSSVCARVSEIFGDKFDPDVIQLILEDCNWEENEAIEKLFQLSNDDTSAEMQSECLGLDIIACDFLHSESEDMCDLPAETENPGSVDTDFSSSLSQAEEAGIRKDELGHTSCLTYNYTQLSQACDLPLHAVPFEDSGLSDMDLSLSAHVLSIGSGQWDSTDGGTGKDSESVSYQTRTILTSTDISVTDKQLSAALIQQSSSMGKRNLTRPVPELQTELISSFENSLQCQGEKPPGVSQPGIAITTPVPSKGCATSSAQHTGISERRCAKSTGQSHENSTSTGPLSAMGLSADAPEFKPSFRPLPPVSSAPANLSQFSMPDVSVYNRPVHPASVGNLGDQAGKFSSAYQCQTPMAYMFGIRTPHQAPVNQFQPVANTGNVTLNRFVGQNLYRPVHPFPPSVSGTGTQSSSPMNYSAVVGAAQQAPSPASLSSSVTATDKRNPTQTRKSKAAESQSVNSSSSVVNSPSVKRIMQYGQSKVLVIMRGLPGSGKSYLARKIQGSGQVFSTDEYFIRGNVYDFFPEKLPQAHEWNKKRVRKALDDGVTPVIVDNTNVQIWEMHPYAEMAYVRGYAIEILEPDTPWKFQPKRLAKLNVHKVRIESIKNMRDRYDTIDTAGLVRLVQKKMEQKTQQKGNSRTKSSSSSSSPESKKTTPVSNCGHQPAQQAVLKPRSSGQKDYKITDKELASITDHCLKLQLDGAREEEIDAWLFMANLKNNEKCAIKDFLKEIKSNSNEKREKTDKHSLLSEHLFKTSYKYGDDSKLKRSQEPGHDCKPSANLNSGDVLDGNNRADGSLVSKLDNQSLGTEESAKPGASTADSLSWTAPQPQRGEKRGVLSGPEVQLKNACEASTVAEGKEATAAHASTWDSSLPQRGHGERPARFRKDRESGRTGAQSSWESQRKVEPLGSWEYTDKDEHSGSIESASHAELPHSWKPTSSAESLSSWKSSSKAELSSKLDLINSADLSGMWESLRQPELSNSWEPSSKAQVPRSKAEVPHKLEPSRRGEWSGHWESLSLPELSDSWEPSSKGEVSGSATELSKHVAEGVGEHRDMIIPEDRSMGDSSCQSSVTKRTHFDTGSEGEKKMMQFGGERDFIPVADRIPEANQNDTEIALNLITGKTGRAEVADTSKGPSLTAESESSNSGSVEDHRQADLNKQTDLEPKLEACERGGSGENIVRDTSRESSVAPYSETTDTGDSCLESKTCSDSGDGSGYETDESDLLVDAKEQLDDLPKDGAVILSSVVNSACTVEGTQAHVKETELLGSPGSEPSTWSDTECVQLKSDDVEKRGLLNPLTQPEREMCPEPCVMEGKADTEYEQREHAKLEEKTVSANSASNIDQSKHDKFSDSDVSTETGQLGHWTELKEEGARPVCLQTGNTVVESFTDDAEGLIPVEPQSPKSKLLKSSLPECILEKTELPESVKDGEKHQAPDCVMSITCDQLTEKEDSRKDMQQNFSSTCIVLVDYSSSEESCEEERSSVSVTHESSAAESSAKFTAAQNPVQESKADSRTVKTVIQSRHSVSEPSSEHSPSFSKTSGSLGSQSGNSDLDPRPSLPSSSGHSSPANPVIHNHTVSAMTTVLSDSSDPASPHRVRKKRLKPRPTPFFEDSVKIQLKSDSWKNFEPERQIFGTEVSKAKNVKEGGDSKSVLDVKDPEFSNAGQAKRSCSHATTQTEGKDFGVLLRGTSTSEQDYVIIGVNGYYKCSENIDVLTRHKLKTTCDRSTMVDISEEPSVDQMYSLFPEVAKAHLKEVLEVCNGDVTEAIELMLEWGITNPITPHDKRHLSKETFGRKTAEAVEAGGKSVEQLPPRLVDFCMKVLSQAGADIQMIEQKVINSGEQRLQRIENSEYHRLRSISVENNQSSPVGVNLLPDFPLTAFTSSTQALHNSWSSESSTEPLEVGSVNELQYALGKTRGLDESAGEACENSHLPSPPRASMVQPGTGEAAQPGEASLQQQAEGDLTLSLPATLVSNLEQLFGPLPSTGRGPSAPVAIQLDHKTAHHLYLCLAQALSALHVTSEEDRLRQLREDEALAHWLQGEEEVDHTLQSIATSALESSLQQARPQHHPGEVSVEFQQVPVHHRVHGKPANLKDIMDEEMEKQKIRERQAKVLAVRGDHIAIATKLKREKLQQHFPGVDEQALEEIFQANGYCLETTVSVITSALGGKRPVSHRLEMPSADFKALVEEKYTIEAVKHQSLQDTSMVRERGEQFQRMDAFSHPVQDYQELRQEALLHHYMRKECFQKAHDAHRRGMRDVADFYSKQGHGHYEKMKEANLRASERLLETRHEKLQQEMTLDLHGFHVEEAIGILKRVMEEKEKEFHQKPVHSRHYLNVITGRGKHSLHGVPRLRPAIIAHLEATGYKYVETKPGLLRVYLHPPPTPTLLPE